MTTPLPRVMWRNGYLWLRLAAYDPVFLAMLRRVIPGRKRRWFPERGLWRIHGDHELAVLGLLNMAFGGYEPVEFLDGDGDVQEPAAR